MIVTVVNTTLFHVAAVYLGDATLWNLVANANGLTDPMIDGTVQLVLPLLFRDIQAGEQLLLLGKQLAQLPLSSLNPAAWRRSCLCCMPAIPVVCLAISISHPPET